MAIPPCDAERLIRWLVWTGGAASTAAGAWATSWGTSKIRVYHDNRQSHHNDLKAKVLIPLREALNRYLPLFGHEEPAVFEAITRCLFAEGVRAEEEAEVSVPNLYHANPWPAVLGSLDPSLFLDAKMTHMKTLMAETVA
jgi:hypothetical protein